MEIILKRKNGVIKKRAAGIMKMQKSVIFVEKKDMKLNKMNEI